LPNSNKKIQLEPGDDLIERIRNAYHTVAKIISLYGDAYLPIFERLHNELKTAESKCDLKLLAIQIGNSNDKIAL